MEVRLARWFDYRQNLIVPNVHWGMNMHECDLLIVSQAGYVTEVEIKVSKYDLKKDADKKHNHDSGAAVRVIKYLYFAVPEKLKCAALEFAPERAGILTVAEKDPGDFRPLVRRIREPKVNKCATKMSERERYRVARLGALRIWRLKERLSDAASTETD